MKQPEDNVGALRAKRTRRARQGLIALSLVVAVAWSIAVRARSAAAQAVPTPTLTNRATPATSARASLEQPAPTPASVETPHAPNAAESAGRHTIVSYLGQVISWARHIEVEESLATEPAETLFVADDRQMADEVVKLAFEHARAEAALLKAKAQAAPVNSAEGAMPLATEPATEIAPYTQGVPPKLDELIARRSEAKAELERVEGRIKSLKDRLARATRRNRDQLNTQLVAAQGELDLGKSRVDSISAMIDFETGTTAGGRVAGGLDAQIDELERSIPAAGSQPKLPNPSGRSATPAPSGIMEHAAQLVGIRRKEQTLDDTIKLAQALIAVTERLRTPLADGLREIDRRALAMTARIGSGDLASVKQNKADFERLTQQHKLITDALLPLSKQTVILNLYVANVERWRKSVQQRFNEELKTLLIRILGLFAVLMVVFVGALVWRKLTFRYVEDLQRRHQLLQLRRLLVIVAVTLVLLFDFANELGTLATVMGFAAAGIALTLQNVILSMAGYFYMSGRFGIRAGDRVQISGISGDVLEIGFFKMTLMELTSDGNGHQATGRAVVFPNSVVFQPNGNFFKQLPGSTFTWSELRLTLAPECDYRLAEKRLVEVVNQVYARYRDRVQGEYRGLERELNMRIETPRPQSRMQIGANGIEMVIRYPAQLQSAVQTSDEIARRIVDAIKREPGLKLVAPATPAIQPAADAEPSRATGDGLPLKSDR